jgi:phage pi2 protein 07
MKTIFFIFCFVLFARSTLNTHIDLKDLDGIVLNPEKITVTINEGKGNRGDNDEMKNLLESDLRKEVADFIKSNNNSNIDLDLKLIYSKDGFIIDSVPTNLTNTTSAASEGNNFYNESNINNQHDPFSEVDQFIDSIFSSDSSSRIVTSKKEEIVEESNTVKTEIIEIVNKTTSLHSSGDSEINKEEEVKGDYFKEIVINDKENIKSPFIEPAHELNDTSNIIFNETMESSSMYNPDISNINKNNDKLFLEQSQEVNIAADETHTLNTDIISITDKTEIFISNNTEIIPISDTQIQNIDIKSNVTIDNPKIIHTNNFSEPIFTNDITHVDGTNTTTIQSINIENIDKNINDLNMPLTNSTFNTFQSDSIDIKNGTTENVFEVEITTVEAQNSKLDDVNNASMNFDKSNTSSILSSQEFLNISENLDLVNKDSSQVIPSRGNTAVNNFLLRNNTDESKQVGGVKNDTLSTVIVTQNTSIAEDTKVLTNKEEINAVRIKDADIKKDSNVYNNISNSTITADNNLNIQDSSNAETAIDNNTYVIIDDKADTPQEDSNPLDIISQMQQENIDSYDKPMAEKTEETDIKTQPPKRLRNDTQDNTQDGKLIINTKFVRLMNVSLSVLMIGVLMFILIRLIFAMFMTTKDD